MMSAMNQALYGNIWRSHSWQFWEDILSGRSIEDLLDSIKVYTQENNPEMRRNIRPTITEALIGDS